MATLRVANLKSIVDDPAAEEGNLVQLSDGSFYVVFRTANGFMGRAVSSDGIRFEDRLFVECERPSVRTRVRCLVLI